jgi:hypothetical protein
MKVLWVRREVKREVNNKIRKIEVLLWNNKRMEKDNR